MDTMLGIGRQIGSVAYRDIVGDTTEWKRTRKALLKRRHLKRVRKLLAALEKSNIFLYLIADEAHSMGLNPFAVLREWKKSAYQTRREAQKKAGIKLPSRRPPRKPALAPRRPGEARIRGRYSHPPRIPAAELKLGYLRHIPPAARIWA